MSKVCQAERAGLVTVHKDVGSEGRQFMAVKPLMETSHGLCKWLESEICEHPTTTLQCVLQGK